MKEKEHNKKTNLNIIQDVLTEKNEMSKFIRRKNGITLIALVVTIIVLLILARNNNFNIKWRKWNIWKCKKVKRSNKRRRCKRSSIIGCFRK